MLFSGRSAALWALVATLLIPAALRALATENAAEPKAGSAASPRALEPRVVIASPGVLSDRPHFAMTSFYPNPEPVVQAVGSTHQPEDVRATDRDAYLRHATELPIDSLGLEVINPRLQRHYGTYELVELLQQVGARFDQAHPGQVLRIGDLSRRRGGTIRGADGERIHSSHRNGLDADVMFLRSDCHDEGRFDARDCDIDVIENLELMRLFVTGGPKDADTLVDVIYVGRPFQQRVCRYLSSDEEAAERYREVVERMQLQGGHTAHFHVRILCPEHSRRCAAPRRHRPPLCPALVAQERSRGAAAQSG